MKLLDHRVKNLPVGKPNAKHFLSFFSWFWVTKMAHIISLVMLAMILWVEIFSAKLQSQGQSDFNWTFLPVAFLLLKIPLNVVLRVKLLGINGIFDMANGFLSVVFPIR